MKKTGIITAMCFLLAGFAANLSASQKIVTFDYNITTKQSGQKELQNIDGKIVRELRIINAIVAQFPDTIKDSKIYTLKGVTNVEEDVYSKWIESSPKSFADIPLPTVADIISQTKTSDSDTWEFIPNFIAPKSDEEEKEMPWGIVKVNAKNAWSVTQGDMVKVAIVDTGVDSTHQDLAPNYAGGYNAIKPGSEPIDDHGHGTHVAGTIAAIKDSKGVVGVAPKAAIYGVKVLDGSGGGSYSTIIAGIEWCVDNDIKVINMSLGGRSSIDSFHKAVKVANEKGVTVVCAAGNDSGAVNYPARYAETIAVSASDSSNKIAYFSSRGAEIDFIAPGVNVYSTYKGDAYKTMSGTSMACPHMAGLAALAVSLGNTTPAEVKEALAKASIDIGLSITLQGNGLVDAGKLVK